MNIFKSVGVNFLRLGFSWNGSMSPNRSIKITNFMGFFLIAISAISQCILLTQANNFDELTESIFMISTTMMFAACYTAATFKISYFDQFVNIFQNIVDSRMKYRKPKALYEKTNQKVEKYTELIYLFVVKITVAASIIPKPFIGLVAYFIMDLGRDSFQLPLPMWFPFDTKNLCGYFIATSVEYALINGACFFSANFFAFIIGCYQFATATIKDMKGTLRSINKKAKRSAVNQLLLLKQLSEFIEINSSSTQAIKKFEELFQPIVFTNLAWSVLTIAIATLMMEMQLSQRQDDVFMLFENMCEVFWSFGGIFFYCECGQWLSEAFEEVDDEIDQLNWYLFPEEINRMLPAIIANVQKPVELACFGSISCGRESFKRVSFANEFGIPVKYVICY